MLLPPDMMVLTKKHLIAWARRYRREATPTGFIFGFGSLISLSVGTVIVHQIRFSDTARHLKGHATPKATGFSIRYRGRAVLILTMLGFVPGSVASILLDDVVGKGTILPLGTTPNLVPAVFTLIFATCAGAGLLAMRQLRDAAPTTTS